MTVITIPSMESLRITTSNAILNESVSNIMPLASTDQKKNDHTITLSCSTQAKKVSLITGRMVKWIYKSQEAARQSDTL